MTCIVGIAQGGVVYMGADSIGHANGQRNIVAVRKLIRVDEFLIGYTTSFRMGQILQYHLSVRPQANDESDERYMVVAFTEAVRSVLRDMAFTEIDKNQETGGRFLVGYRGNLYEIYPDFQVSMYVSGISACGAGEHYALGAMLAMPKLSPVVRIKRALEVAGKLSVYVAPPYHIEILKSDPAETD